jgi:arylsulfatase A-like enzyme
LIQLDPRLADGRSAAAVLMGKRRVLSNHRFGVESKEPSPWRIEGGEVLPTTDGMGLMVGSRHGSFAEQSPLQLVHGETIEASEVSGIELLIRKKTAGTAVLKWRVESDPAQKFYTLSVPVIGSEQPQTLRFNAVQSPHWIGNITDLFIAPSWEGSSYFRLGEVRLISEGFLPFESRLAKDSGDGGLFTRGRICRRVWPSDLGVPLHASCIVPENARFIAYPAIARSLGAEPIRFRIEARIKGRDWNVLHDVDLASNQPWRPLKVDLSSFAGYRTELRLTALRRNEAVQEKASPLRALVYWAEPRVVGDPTGDKPPNVLLVTLDTTRADHVGDPRYTPCLARIGAEGIVFDNAWSNCNSTTPSHASILTGRYLFEHGTLNNRTAMAEENLTLAERFRKAGYATAAAVSVGHIDSTYGFGQGMDRMNVAAMDTLMDGALTLQHALQWIEEWKQDGIEPFFLWLHFFDPHIPYQPPEEYLDAFADRLGIEQPPVKTDVRTVPVLDDEYDGHQTWLGDISNHDHVTFLYRAGVGYADHLVEKAVVALKEKGLYDDTWVVVTADHGECLGEHDIWYSHEGLFNETLEVPLIVKPPGGPAGIRHPHPVSTLDIVPTLVKHLGLEPAEGLPGRDLLSAAGGRTADPKRRLWFEYMGLFQLATRDSRYHFITTLGRLPEVGLLTDPDTGLQHFGKGKPVEPGTHFLFDLKNDQELERDLAKEETKLAENYLKMIREWQQRLSRGTTRERTLSKEEMERLRQLGYAGY